MFFSTLRDVISKMQNSELTTVLYYNDLDNTEGLIWILKSKKAYILSKKIKNRREKKM